MEEIVDVELENLYQSSLAAFRNYTESLKSLLDVMKRHGIETMNVDPYANFAEILVAHQLKGRVQKATNAGFDVKTGDGIKIQVKSLRISSAKPFDNGRGWYECTRIKGNPASALIDADKVAIVVYIDHAPYCILVFPVIYQDKFPIINVKVLDYKHVTKLLADQYKNQNSEINVIDLRDLNIACVDMPST